MKKVLIVAGVMLLLTGCQTNTPKQQNSSQIKNAEDSGVSLPL